MINDLLTGKDKVEQILQDHPETRDSDKLLWLAFMAIHHGLKESLGNESYMILKELLMKKSTPAMESVRRLRQKFQEEGRYLGTKRLRKMDEAELVKQWSLGVK